MFSVCWVIFMDFAEAIEFSKKFPASCPKIFKGFIEWGLWDTKTEGYVILANAASGDFSSDKLEDYVKSHGLKGHVKDYLMICSSFK